MDNIKEYIVKYKPNRIPIVTGLQQWDYGQHLIIQGIPLDELYETNVYFCFADSLKCFPSKNGVFEENEINVQIPKFIFQKQIDNCCDKEYKAYAFIYLKNGEYGKTIYKIALEIEIMPKPDEYEYEEEKLYFEELTSMLELKADGLKYINNVLYLLAENKTISSVTIKSGSGNGTGTDGREIELRNNGTYIQWCYVGDEEWINLVALSDLKGNDGKNGFSIYTSSLNANHIAGILLIDIETINVPSDRELQIGDLVYLPNKGDIFKIISLDELQVRSELIANINGKDGITPHIGNNGNWYLGEEDTNVKAQGIDGRGIKSIEKTSSTGNIDTYTMTFTDNTTFTYNVVNASSDSGGIVAETDPTVPSWAKQPTKPSYTAEEVGALPNTIKIPVNTSDLNNDNEFITKTVTDLVNYYTKSQSYSKDEIDNKLSAIPKFSIQPVEQLPTSNISETTVYLLKTGDETNNLYTEYIYVGGKWEYLGKQTIDLSGYALKTEIPTKLSDLTNDAGFITNTVSNLVNYYSKSETYSKSEIDAKGYLTEHQDLSDYAKKNEVPKNLSQLNQDSTHRVVTDSQVETWNNKSNFSGNYNDLTDKPTIPSLTGYATETYVQNYAQPKGDYATNEKVSQLEEQIVDYIGEEIPDYWQTHLDEKIPLIQALQNDGGKDCFSFVEIVDSHVCLQDGYEWKPISPLIAKKVMDACDIKYLLYDGDVNHRGCYNTKAELERDNEYINNVMFKPVINRLLRTLGNHDFNYGNLDRDGNGVINNYDDGTIKPVEERETYVYSFTDGEKHRQVFRKVGMVGDVHFDESGTGYWIDDISNKVRYIILNTHNTKNELRDDGTQKYPSMWLFRFQQAQYDMVIEALTSVPSDDWYVVVGGHVPLDKSGEVKAWGGTNDDDSDCGLMKKLLTAYKNKTTFNGLFEGTAIGSGIVANFTNKVDLNSDDFLDGHYMSINGTNMSIAENDDFCLTNYIPAVCPNKVADLVRIKGHVTSSVDIRYACYDSNKNLLFAGASGTKPDFVTDENGVTSWNVGKVDDYISTANANALAFVRFSFKKATTIEDIIVTVNEEITYTESESTGGGYDAVSVDCDFTSAKGEIAGFFGGHVHVDNSWEDGINIISTRCDGIQENTDELKAERVVGTATEYSFDVFTVNKKTRKIHVTKIGAGSDRVIDII